MSIIKIMDINLSNKIAAGEVVESLMNVVKELVENSIDAQAKNIKIELEESGMKMIKVIDDGIGMDHEDALNCLKRHATSKIYDYDDLFNIHTLGFRGEALPSIASVSHMIIRTSKNELGTEIEVDAGNIINDQPSSLKQGTTIEVTNIFYNTPARLKYLKSLYTELANITNYINKIALARPEIKFILTNNGNEILNTDGSNNQLKVIYNIYGLDAAKKMVKISAKNNDYEIDGYISYPELSRSSRNSITILLNKRSLKSYEITKTILESYHTYIPKDKFPIVILNITTDPSLVDINIHPTKMEAKFSKIDELRELIYNEISKALEKLSLIPEIKYDKQPIANINEVTTINNEIDYSNKEEIKPIFENISFDFTEKNYEINENTTEEEKPVEKFKMFNTLALIHGTYIIGENEDGMYIVDQHAANERINYEYYLKEMGKSSSDCIDLLVPIKLEFSNQEYLILKQNFNILDELGIKYEEFGFNTLIIRSHPTWIKKDYVTESLRKIIEVIISKEKFDKEKFNEAVAITLACKMSIKANEHISPEEMQNLIERLSKTSNPFTCPHGRPTTIFHSNYELEKLFKRVMN